ncbi:MAG: hypothetical protein H0U33_04655 [Solirubrobacterales bacterium]|nr:hypothetical protein [Solirubrobacterales bacterium]
MARLDLLEAEVASVERADHLAVSGHEGVRAVARPLDEGERLVLVDAIEDQGRPFGAVGLDGEEHRCVDRSLGVGGADEDHLVGASQDPLERRRGDGADVQHDELVEARCEVEHVGDDWHAHRTARRRDHARDADIQALGLMVVRVLADDLEHRPAETARLLASLLGVRAP